MKTERGYVQNKNGRQYKITKCSKLMTRLHMPCGLKPRHTTLKQKVKDRETLDLNIGKI